MSTQTRKGFTESTLATLGPFVMNDPEERRPVEHAPTPTRKGYTTYIVTVKPRDYEPALFEVEVFGRTFERMRVLEYTRKDKLIVATVVQATTEGGYDSIALSLGGYTK